MIKPARYNGLRRERKTYQVRSLGGSGRFCPELEGRLHCFSPWRLGVNWWQATEGTTGNGQLSGRPAVGDCERQREGLRAWGGDSGEATVKHWSSAAEEVRIELRNNRTEEVKNTSRADGSRQGLGSCRKPEMYLKEFRL